MRLKTRQAKEAMPEKAGPSKCGSEKNLNQKLG